MVLRSIVLGTLGQLLPTERATSNFVLAELLLELAVLRAEITPGVWGHEQREDQASVSVLSTAYCEPPRADYERGHEKKDAPRLRPFVAVKGRTPEEAAANARAIALLPLLIDVLAAIAKQQPKLEISIVTHDPEV